MKTSLVSPLSPFAEVGTAALSKPLTVHADRPQQLQSVTIYWRGRKMVLMQRPQRRLSALLCKMLRRSWQNLFGTLVRGIGVGAMAAALTAQAGVASSLPANALPSGGVVQYGTVNNLGAGGNISAPAGNQLTLQQTTNQAIIDWQSFSIGSGASVKFVQNNANSVALNRVTGKDPSIIMGSLSANGKIFLINAAGILVGKTGKIDVAGFTASTLNISDDDFKAGKMNFAADAGKTIGDVKIEAGGAITSKSGGSVYLIGANVENNGIITAPDGEVLLAAGSSVQLVDTSLPGVTINVGGIDGKVTNLGQIIASAGTIGIGAALIDNSGIINASSVEKQGGRIFLRATKQLTTDATSKINADGITGGNVQLYSDQVANIDGDVSALGSAGNGGYVDTSGKTVLSVQYVPRVGPGGTWFIDPHDVTIVDSGTDLRTNEGNGAITASGDSAFVLASTIEGTLNNGTSVSIWTNNDNYHNQKGNITVNAAIIKSNGSIATLTLNAGNDITINNNITSNGNSTGMNLELIAAGGNITSNGGIATSGGNLTMSAAGGNITSNGGITTSGGNLTVSSSAFVNNSTLSLGGGTASFNSSTFVNNNMLSLGGGTATFSSDLQNTACGTVAGTGTINFTGGTGTLINDGIVQINSGAGSTVGNLIIGGNYRQNSGGTLEAGIGRIGDSGVLVSDQLQVKGNVSLAGALQISPAAPYTYNYVFSGQLGDKVAIVNYGLGRTGAFDTMTGTLDVYGGLPSSLFLNYLLPVTGSGHDISLAYAPAGSNYFTGAQGLDWNTTGNWFSGVVPSGSSADVYIDTGSGNTVTHATAVNDAIRALTIASGGLDVSNGSLAVSGSATVYGSLSASGTSTLQLNGNTVINGSFATSDTAALSIGYSGVLSGSGTLGINGGNLTIDGSINTGGSDLTMNSSGNVILGSINTSNLTVNALGSIAQVSNPTGGLTITGTMTATANTGIKLDNGNGTCGTNHVANFSARNNGTGDITLVNNDFPTDLAQVNNKLVSIHNAGGNITVENTGGMTTVGLVDASAGSVHLFTHSPLTIGAGGISAGNGVTLAAGTSGSSGDVLTVNGVIQTVSGTVAFAGNSVLSNAAIYGPNAPVFNSPNPVVFGSNYVYATSPPNLTPVTPPIMPPTPVTPLIVPPASIINTIDQNVASTTSTNNENNNNTGTLLPLPMITTMTTLTKTSTDQTIGGSDGEFGGSTKDDKKDTTAKSTKPLPVCT